MSHRNDSRKGHSSNTCKEISEEIQNPHVYLKYLIIQQTRIIQLEIILRYTRGKYGQISFNNHKKI